MKHPSLKVWLSVIFILFSMKANGYDIKVDGIYYNVDVNAKTVSVTSGEDKYFGELEIPSKISYANKTLSVISIGYQAFASCDNLLSVTIPNSVVTIENDGFLDCINLKFVKIPNSVVSLGDFSFYNCSKLEAINIPNSVTSIGKQAFQYCRSLKKIIIPNSVVSIGYHAFGGCNNLRSVELSSSIETIPWSMFSGCVNLVSVTIPNSVTHIDDSAFYGCFSLESINIPNSVITIGEGAFQNCSNLKLINIPSSVKTIRQKAFMDCYGLQEIVISKGLSVIEGSAFEDCKGLNTVAIPSSVKEIGYAAFRGCENLKNITFTNGNEELKFTSADKVGPFEGAPLENIYVGRIIKKPNDYTNINWSLYNFQKETIKNISIGDNILDASFFDPESCTRLEEINCYCIIPPIIPQFSVSQYINVMINIPEGTLSQYQDNSEWNKFWKLNETLSTPSVIENIILNETQLELIPAQVFKLIAIGEPENLIFDDIKWSSSDPNIASVDNDGLVTAISPGIVTITVSIGDCSASCIVTVLSNWTSIDNISFFDNVPIEVYSIDGIPLFNIVDMSEITSLPKGIYIIKNGRDTIKIIR